MNNDKTLREYAVDQGIAMSTVYYKAKKGTLGEQTYIENGKTYVRNTAEIKKDNKPVLNISPVQPQFTLMGSQTKPLEVAMGSTATRRNAASKITPTDRFNNIESGLSPIKFDKNRVGGNCYLNINECLSLVRLAYYNVAIVRNIIDVMVEFSVSDIFLTGGNKKTRDFFYAFFKKINIQELQEWFFMCLFRESNVFLYPYMGKVGSEDLKKLVKTFGSNLQISEATKAKIPLKYTVLNAADIQLLGTATFTTPQYYKLLTDYELEALKNPRSEEDKEIFDSFDEETKKKIKEKKSGAVSIGLLLNM